MSCQTLSPASWRLAPVCRPHDAHNRARPSCRRNHTNANIELKPKRTTKDRGGAAARKAKAGVRAEEGTTPKADGGHCGGSECGRDQPKKRRSKLSKSPREGLPAPVVVPSEYLTTQQAAAYLNLSRQYLEAARYRGDGSGPAYVKLERAVRYRRSVLDAWMSAHDHSPDKPSLAE